jgi:hypothetical protein
MAPAVLTASKSPATDVVPILKGPPLEVNDNPPTEVVTPDVVRPPTPSTISADLAVKPTVPTKLFEGLESAISPSGAVSDVVPPMTTAADCEILPF